MNYYNEEAMAAEYERDRQRFLNLSDPPAGMQAYMIMSRLLAKFDITLLESQCAWTASPKGTLFRGTETFFLPGTNGKNFTVGRRYCLYTCLPKGISTLGLRKGDYIGVFGDVPTSSIVVRTGRYFVCAPYGKCKIKQWVVFAGFTETNELVTDIPTVISWAQSISRSRKTSTTGRRGRKRTSTEDPKYTYPPDQMAGVTALQLFQSRSDSVSVEPPKTGTFAIPGSVVSRADLEQPQKLTNFSEDEFASVQDFQKDFPISESGETFPTPAQNETPAATPREDLNKQQTPATPSTNIHPLSPSVAPSEMKQDTPAPNVFSPFPYFPY